MILSCEQILDGWPFVARRWGLEHEPSESAVRAALEHADQLAGGDTATEPAAVFFAFGSRRRVFVGAWRVMAALLAASQARSNGLRLTASAEELDALLTDIMFGRASFVTVVEWFAPRLARREDDPSPGR